MFRADAYATGEALYALHVSGDVPTNDPVYQKGVQWLLRNQLADGSWFAPATSRTRAAAHVRELSHTAGINLSRTLHRAGQRWRCSLRFRTKRRFLSGAISVEVAPERVVR